MHTSIKGIITDKFYPFIRAVWRTTSQVSLLMLMLLFLAPTTQADHIAYGKLTWTSGGGRTIKYHVKLAFRRDEYRINERLPIVGDILDDYIHRIPAGEDPSIFKLHPGHKRDGGPQNPADEIPVHRYKVLTVDTAANLITVVAVDENNTPYFSYTIPDDIYTYYHPYLLSCARVHHLANDGGGCFDGNGMPSGAIIILNSVLTLGGGKSSPDCNLPPVINVPVSNGQNTLFTIPISDPNGDQIIVKVDEFAQGLSEKPPGLTIEPEGRVKWNNQGLNYHDYYALQFIVSTDDADEVFGLPSKSIQVSCLLKITDPAANNPPTLVISPTGPLTVNSGSPVSFTVTANSGDAGQEVEMDSNDGQLPSNAEVCNGGTCVTVPNAIWPAEGTPSVSRTINWTPTAQQIGKHVFLFTARDAKGVEVNKSIEITVSGSGNPPVITAPDVVIMQPEVAGTFQVTATDANGGTLVLEMIEPLINGATFPTQTGVAPRTGTFTWTPPLYTLGTKIARFKATDNTGRTAYKIVTIRVDLDDAIELTSPIDGAIYTGTTTPSIPLAATVYAQSTITHVKFYDGATLLGTDSVPPYAMTWSTASKGVHIVRAEATLANSTVLVSATATITVQPKYTLTEIPTHGGFYSTAYSINTSGQVTGYANENYYPPSGGSQVLHALRWSSGSGLQNLLDPWGSTSYGYPHKTLGWAINDSGIVVGEAIHYTYNTQTAFKWNNGYTLLGSLSGGSAVASAINGNSVIVGTSTILNGSSYVPRATRWLAGSTTANNLGSLQGLAASQSFAYGINTAGKIVGKSHSPEGPHRAYLMPATSITIAPSDELGTISFNSLHSSEAWDVNDSDEVVGGSHVNTGEFHAFYRPANGSMIDLGTFGGTFSLAYAINSSGHIVGQARNAQSVTRAFLYVKNIGVMQDLTALVPNTSWTLVSAEDINNDGKIVGWGYNPYGEARGFVLTPNF